MITSTPLKLRITLQDCTGIKPELRARAEARFAKVLQRSFANEEDMARALKLFNDAAEGGLISKADEKQARSWQQAYEAARQSGLQDISVEEAFFDVRLH